MKNKLIGTLLLLLFIQNLFSQEEKQYKEYRKLLEKYDVHIHNKVPSNVSENSDVFWNYVLENNVEYKKFHSSYSRYKKSIIAKFNEKVEEQSYLYNEQNGLYDYAPDSIMTAVKSILTGENLHKKLRKIYIQNTSDYNAFSTPDGIIAITDGLDRHINFSELMGVFAHETAHYLLDHALIHSFKSQKKERNYNLIAGALAVTNAGANAWAQAQGGYDEKTSKESWEDVNKIAQSLFDGAKESSILYKYKYSREQEIEADILAYRFLEFAGLSPSSYIDVLKKLMSLSPADMTSPYRDHPSFSFRIGLLKYMELLDKNGVTLTTKHVKKRNKEDDIYK